MESRPETPDEGAARGRARPRWALVVGTLVVMLGGAAAYALLRGDGLVAPEPRPGAEAGTLSPLPTSTLQLPVELDLADVVRLVEDVVPRRFGDLSDRQAHPSDDRLRYAYEVERDSMRIELRGDTVHLTTVLRYGGRTWYRVPVVGEVSASCAEGAGRPRAILELSSPVEVGPDWSLRTRTRVERLEPFGDGERDRCRLEGLQLDLTELLLAAVSARMDDAVAARLDSVMARLDLREPLSRYWARMGEPVAVGDGLWFVLNPVDVRRARLTGEVGSDLAVADLVVGARPRITLGARPAPSSLPLPRFDRIDTGEGLHVLLEGRADYDALSALLSDELRRREFVAAGRPVEIREARVRGLGDGRVAVELTVRGALTGRIFFVGTPRYDVATGELRVPDLDFHVETRNLLVRTAAWILRAGFPEYLRRHARWPLDEPLRRARSLAGERLDHPIAEGIRLEGELGSAELAEAVALADAIVVRFVVTGRARVVADSG